MPEALKGLGKRDRAPAGQAAAPRSRPAPAELA